VKNLPASPVFWWSIAIALVAFSMLVSVQVLRTNAYSQPQKTRQLLLIWFVPFLGAAVVQWFVTDSARDLPDPDREFTPQDTGPSAGG
jgi:hypothetical protein